jgi:hypothetical protein
LDEENIMAKRRTPKPRMTVEEQAAELARLDGEMQALHAQQMALSQQLGALGQCRARLITQLVRDRLQESLGEFVKLTGYRSFPVPMRRLQPVIGDIGRLVKIGRSRVLVDFGEELGSWYVPLGAIGTVQDPLAKSVDDISVDRMLMEARAENQERLDELIAGPDELPDEDDEEGEDDVA